MVFQIISNDNVYHFHKIVLKYLWNFLIQIGGKRVIHLVIKNTSTMLMNS